MIVTLFNGLSGLQVRGISKVGDELALHIRKCGHTVHEVKIPRSLYFNNSISRILILIFFQQLIVPIVALKSKSDLLIDPYNGFSILASLFIKTKYFIHDYTPFKRSYWYFRPGTIYQFVIFKIDIYFSLADMYHDGMDIDTPKFLRRTTAPKIFPCIVDPLDASDTDFFEINIQPVLNKNDGDFLFVSTISGAGWNKNFEGLVEHLKELRTRFILVAFGFGDQGIKHEVLSASENIESNVITVGFVNEAAISSTLLRSRIFVFHSLSEGFGRPIIEALQLKKIVLTVYAPVIGLLSKEALKNIYIYNNKENFQSQLYAALDSEFYDFTSLYRDEIDQDIDHFLQ